MALTQEPCRSHGSQVRSFESIVYANGSYAPSDPIVLQESAGTSTYTFWSGSLFESVVFADGSSSPGVGDPIFESMGTQTIAFISGGTETLVFPVEFTEATNGTVAYFSGSIHQF